MQRQQASEWVVYLRHVSVTGRRACVAKINASTAAEAVALARGQHPGVFATFPPPDYEAVALEVD